MKNYIKAPLFVLAVFVMIMAFAQLANAVGEFTFSGTTPTEREDSTALGLSEIAGFNIHCGIVSGDYQDTVFFPGATLPDTTWIVTTLPLGDNYCVVTTVDIDGRKSVYSNEIKLVNEGKSRPKPPMIPPNQVITIHSTLD